MSLDVIILKKMMIETTAEIYGIFASLLVLIFMFGTSKV